MPRATRVLTPSEIDTLQAMIKNGIPIKTQMQRLHLGMTTYNSIVSDLRQKGILPPEGIVQKKDEEKEEDKDILIKPTVTKFLTKSSDTLSDDMTKELQGRLKAAKALKDAEYLYRSNVESMGFDWNDWVETALKQFYQDTLEWYETEGKKLTPEKIMELVTQEATLREFAKEM